MKTPSERRAALIRLVESRTVTRVAPSLLLPAAPFFDLAGEEFGRELFITQGINGVEYCLRPDFTLPIAKAYLDGGLAGEPAAYTYLGPIFRQGFDGPEEYDQAGLELLGQEDAGQALDQVLTFARWALAIYGITSPQIRLGGVGLFEAFLVAAGFPEIWRKRIRSRFGHPDAMNRLLERLVNPPPVVGPAPDGRGTLVEIVTDAMLQSGLPIAGGRTPEEIADRYLEKQELAASALPPEKIQLLADYLGTADRAQIALDRILQLTRKSNVDLEGPIFDVRNHAAALAALSPKAEVVFDASFSPRLDYYTGIVFEMTGVEGTVLASGGEYDLLMERLGADIPVAASGCALWVDRLEKEATE